MITKSNNIFSFHRIPECKTTHSEMILQKCLRENYARFAEAVSNHTQHLQNLTSSPAIVISFFKDDLKDFSINYPLLKSNINFKLDDDFSVKKDIFITHNGTEREKIGYLKVFFPQKVTFHDDLCCSIAAQSLSIQLDNLMLKVTNHQTRESLLRSLSFNLRMKDPYTYEHSRNVQTHAAFLAEMAGLPYKTIDTLRVAGLLHDMGKIAIPPEILQKNGSLTPEEWKIMRQHPIYTYEYLSSFDSLKKCARYAYHHHERYDGTGYPDGLSKEKIPLESRILAIADAYDAMTGRRIYRTPMSKQAAADEIRRNAHTQFDPWLANLFSNAILMNTKKGNY